MPHPRYPHVFEPLTIKRTTFKNRIFASPVTTDRIVLNGCPTEEGINAYENRARGGFGQVTVTETFIDFDRGARHDHSLDIVNPAMSVYNQEALAVLTEAIRCHGAIASIQLNHIGAINHPDTIRDHKNPFGPSAYVREDGVQVDEMTIEDMNQVADNYANAVEAARDFGFDMVMLHGGHGWLLGEFLSPLTNHRTDEYGGSIDNRVRFPRMVLERIREKVGSDFLIEYRISGSERVPGGLELSECAEACHLLEDLVDMIHVTSGMYHNHVVSKAFSSMFHPHGCNLDLSEEIKKHVSIPVVAVGGFNDPQQIEDAIASGKCDAVAMGRQQFADPEFANKAYTGREDEIAPCLRCSCFNPLASDPTKRSAMKPFECTVNPHSCRELRLQYAPKPKASRDVLVVGGGVGGMYAAITAAERGHKVTLIEKEKKLGGLLWFTDTDCHKNDLRRYRESLIVRMERLGVKVITGVEATKEMIEAMKPDAVICAVGSEPVVPGIPGLREYADHALSVYAAPDKVGKHVIMIGGGLIGIECSMHLADQGHTVTVVEMMDDYARDALMSHRQAIELFLDREKVDIRCGVACTEVRPDGITIRRKDGTLEDIAGDTVVYAIGMKSRKDVVEALRPDFIPFTPVGDCVKPAKVLDATRGGMYAAYDIL